MEPRDRAIGARDTLRLFVAIELPGEVRAALNDLEHELQRHPGLNALLWVRPEGIHITLKFLGERPADHQPPIDTAVKRAVEGIQPFELRLGRLGTFGGSAPRVLWVDVEGDTETLKRLQSQVERELRPLGFPTEKRDFAPHLTLARVQPERSRSVAQPLQAAIAQTAAPAAVIPVREIVLMKSDLRPTGAVYTQLLAAPLG
jgi:2'-5' RNA ligase